MVDETLFPLMVVGVQAPPILSRTKSRRPLKLENQATK